MSFVRKGILFLGICAVLGGIAFAAMHYREDLRVMQGVREPSIPVDAELDAAGKAARQECLRTNKIPYEVRDGITYINEEDLYISVMTCA